MKIAINTTLPKLKTVMQLKNNFKRNFILLFYN